MIKQAFFFIQAWFRFLWKSTNEHGVHSPFVFSLVTKCFYDKTDYPEYKLLNTYRKALISNKETISVTDFGAGSNVFTSNKRVISDIAKHAGITSKRAELLFRTVRYFKPGNILELGTSIGLATSALSLGNPDASVITLEGCPETAAVAEKNLAAAKYHNIKIETGEFSSLLSKLPDFQTSQLPDFQTSRLSDFQTSQLPDFPTSQLPDFPTSQLPDFQTSRLSDFQTSQLPDFPTSRLSDFQTFRLSDFIYFDGNHQKEATLHYFNQLLPTAGNDTVWIFDDIHWSKGMEEAWKTIKQNPKVTVTIDTFQWGFVFFRKEQIKQHFTIRV